MAQRCRICGYTFRPDDGSLCPECFTAREDELKFQVKDFKMTNIFGRDKNEEQLGTFLADEMKDELHKDISLKKELDREDRITTNTLNSQGVNVKNETFRDAFHERINRDTTSDPGRVYTQPADPAPAYTSQNTSRPVITPTPTINRTVNNNTTRTANSFTHMTNSLPPFVNQTLQARQNMQNNNNDQQPLTYNFPPRNNNAYKTSSSGLTAVIIVIMSIVLFVALINFFADFEEKNSKKHTATVVETNTSSAQDGDDLSALTALTNDGIYKYTITDCIMGEKTITSKDKDYKKAREYYYSDDASDATPDFYEMTFKLDCEKQVDNDEEMYSATDSTLYLYNGTDTFAVSTSNTAETVDNESFLKFYIPTNAQSFDLNLSLYRKSDNAENFAAFNELTFDILKKVMKNSDNSSESSSKAK